MEILQDREARKSAGLVGCITGRPEPEISFFGYSDVQSWRPADPMDPHCFCFDCRELWDTDGTIDAELVNKGHNGALYAYRNLLPAIIDPCVDCRVNEATRRFNHLDGRSFRLCPSCFSMADHEDDYLAHVEPPRPRIRTVRTTATQGLSNEGTTAESTLTTETTQTYVLPTRTNGGGISAI